MEGEYERRECTKCREEVLKQTLEQHLYDSLTVSKHRGSTWLVVNEGFLAEVVAPLECGEFHRLFAFSTLFQDNSLALPRITAYHIACNMT